MQDTGALCSLPWAPCMGMPSSWELAARQLGLPYGKLSIWGERGGRGGSILVTQGMVVWKVVGVMDVDSWKGKDNRIGGIWKEE